MFSMRYNKDRVFDKPEDRRRPCEVDGSKAWYHGLVHADQAILKADAYEGQADAYAACHREFNVSGKIPMYCDVVVTRKTYAMVEYLDGSVAKVDPEQVHFIDV